MSKKDEKKRQDELFWDRTSDFSNYVSILTNFHIEAILQSVEGRSLLDLACGDGTITAGLADSFERVVGVDASAIHLEKAREKAPSAKFYESLIEEFNIQERFDVVTMINILEHVKDPVCVLKKAASFLSADGVIVVHVPNALAANRVIARMMGTLKDEYELSPWDIEVAGHRRNYDMNTLKQDFQKAGLIPVSSGGVFYKMLSTPQMDWFLKNGLWEGGEFGWGRIGDTSKDWKAAFCRACYDYGKKKPEDCNIIYICAKKNNKEG